MISATFLFSFLAADHEGQTLSFFATTWFPGAGDAKTKALASAERTRQLETQLAAAKEQVEQMQGRERQAVTRLEQVTCTLLMPSNKST